MSEYFEPEVGQLYTNRNGREYRCLAVWETPNQNGKHSARMLRVKDGWTLAAHGVMRYEDGTIEWDWSLDGYFAPMSI